MTATPTTALSYQNFFSATLTSDITDTATDIFLDTIPNGTEGFLVIEPDSTSNREVIYYNSKTATKVVCPSAADGRGQDDTTAHSHSTGAAVIMAPIAAYFETLQTLFTTSPQGWTSLSGTFTSPVQNGNRSCTVTTSVDQRSVISPGHRLRLTRTVAAPTQCTSLNGTTQYYSKTTPSAMTFTNNFVVSAWVKLSSYPATTVGIVSRYNGTSGWRLAVTSSGQLELIGFNAGNTNFKQNVSYQSLPLNKWVHVTGQLDMTAATNSPTINYVMFDGMDVPMVQAQSGTNPTALIQAGNLEIGSYNGGTNFFPGKIAQVAIYNAKVTQANIRLTMGQTLTGAESSLISAYSFNNTINDLNASNANNLTANGSAVATNADAPFAQSDNTPTGFTAGKEEMGIVTALTSSTITFQSPEGGVIPTTGGITAGYYSTYKVPYGMPVQEDKWELNVLVLASISTSGFVAATTYNPGGININVPVGAWYLYFSFQQACTPNASLSDLYAGLQSSSSAFVGGQEKLTSRFFPAVSGSTFTAIQQTGQDKINLSTATPYYALLRMANAHTTHQLRGTTSTTVPEISVIGARCAYL